MKSFFVFLLPLLFIVGCGSHKKITDSEIMSSKFPKALVGVWEGYYSQIHWVVKFTSDGSIEYAKIPFGKFVAPNSEFTFPMQGDDNEMTIKTGEWTVGYTPDSILGVAIELSIDAMTPSGRIEQKGVEHLIGKVDVKKGIWDAIWITEGNYWITPLGEKRIELPPEGDEEKPLSLKRLIRKDVQNPVEKTE